MVKLKWNTMSDSGFIDGLRTRAEKANEPAKISKGRSFTSYETGDPLISRSSRRNLTSSIENEVARKPKKKPLKEEELYSISKKIEHVSKIPEEGFTRKKVRSVETNRPKSYERDVLGIEDDDTIEIDSYDLKKPKKEKKKKHQKKFIFRHKILSFVIIPLVLLASVTYFWGDAIVMKITGGRSGLFDLLRSVVTGGAEFRVGSDGRTNILLFGTSGYDMEGREGDGKHDGAQLTDSIMVLSVDQSTKDIAMISLPRDLKTKTCTAAGKINELYNCENKDRNNEEGGANALRGRVSEMLGIEIQYFAHLNWLSLIQIVDALGGVTVTVDEDINDDWTKTYIKAGVPTTLNGEQALGLARARHGTKDGDFTRGNSQQKILTAISQKITASKLGVPDLINLANILGDNLRTDFSADDIMTAAKMFTETGFGQLRQIPLYADGAKYFTTGIISGISYVYPTAGVDNYNAIKEYIKKSLTSDPVILEDAKTMVLNGSGVEGLAEREKTELEKAGFNITKLGNAPSGEYFGKVYIYDVGNKPATREKIETYYNEKVQNLETMPSGIDTTGIDFVVILGVGYSE